MPPRLALNENEDMRRGLALGVWGSVKGSCKRLGTVVLWNGNCRLKPLVLLVLIAPASPHPFAWVILLMAFLWGLNLLWPDTKHSRCIISLVHEIIWSDRCFESHFKSEEIMAESSEVTYPGSCTQQSGRVGTETWLSLVPNCMPFMSSVFSKPCAEATRLFLLSRVAPPLYDHAHIRMCLLSVDIILL